MENITNQPHRWDLDCIEAGSASHNLAELKLFTKYIKNNPLVKLQMERHLHDFNEYMQQVIDNTETWTGVRQDLISRVRDADGKLPPREIWELHELGDQE